MLISQYEYLSNGQLCKVILPGGRIIEYVCDKRGVRIAKKINGKIVEKYKWKDFSTLEAITDSKGKNKWTFNHDEEASQIVAVFEGKTYYLARDQVGSVFMVADDQGNELKKIIYDSFGNILTDTYKQFHLPLGFASGLNDKDTGLVHFGFREYDPEVGRFTAQDPLGYGGGDVDVYGYCLDDPINFNDAMGLEAGGIWGTTPRREDVKIYYIWKANEGACDTCVKKNGEVFETPATERPHPNCKCQQIEFTRWKECSEWKFIKELKTLTYELVRVHFSDLTANTGLATWHRKYLAEEGRTVKKIREVGDGPVEQLSEKEETRIVRKMEVRTVPAFRFTGGVDAGDGDVGSTTNPWTGEGVPIPKR
ncbi:RHS repeat-associated core domain-containing protein [Maridesulfovibrio sp.]|uniref:RHS repeat domain-containing protein n=1 Tax=Maridesulfovibrio sp. TaxID=2795000 RepID=UPI0029CA7AEA|nr:RHS repeat-associated core domain-containing protein [Maridesulfovibrio sp.]